MLRTPLVLALGLVGLGAAAPLASPLWSSSQPLWNSSQADHTTLPPTAQEVQKALSGLEVDLASAIRAAEGSVEGGRATSAAVDVALAGQQGYAYEVHVYDAKAHHRVLVDAATGEVRESTVVPRFPGDPTEGEWTETESGLKYWDLVVGDGPTPPDKSTTVKVHYTGWLLDGTKFDSSVDRGQAATFPLNRVIPGWTEGVGGMRVGGKRKLVIPFDLAYGASGRPPTIPPKATLVFDVELLEVQ